MLDSSRNAFWLHLPGRLLHCRLKILTFVAIVIRATRTTRTTLNMPHALGVVSLREIFVRPFTWAGFAEEVCEIEGT